MPFGHLNRSLVAKAATVPSGAIFAMELPRQLATNTSPVLRSTATPTGPLNPSAHGSRAQRAHSLQTARTQGSMQLCAACARLLHRCPDVSTVVRLFTGCIE